jgi:hypothetical protein
LQAIEEDRELRGLIELELFKTGLVPELEDGRRQQIDSGIALIVSLAGIMDQGQQQGLLRADREAKAMARAYLAFQNGLIQLWLTAPSQFSLKASAETFADILMAGIQAR